MATTPRTSLADAQISRHCGKRALPATRLTFPASSDRLEALENMKLYLPQVMTVTDAYRARRAYYTIASHGVLRAPTEVSRPGEGANEVQFGNNERSVPVRWYDAPEPLAVGTVLQDVTAILAHDDRGKRMTITTASAQPARPPGLSPKPDGATRVAVVNLHNFFNGDGRGSAFLSRRGAADQREFEEQSRRVAAGVVRLEADLLAISELENDGFGPLSAAASLLGLLNRDGDLWSMVEAGGDRIGNDEITVGLVYRRDRLAPRGPATILSVPPFMTANASRWLRSSSVSMEVTRSQRSRCI